MSASPGGNVAATTTFSLQLSPDNRFDCWPDLSYLRMHFLHLRHQILASLEHIEKRTKGQRNMLKLWGTTCFKNLYIYKMDMGSFDGMSGTNISQFGSFWWARLTKIAITYILSIVNRTCLLENYNTTPSLQPRCIENHKDERVRIVTQERLSTVESMSHPTCWGLPTKIWYIFINVYYSSQRW
jgi:hypothetical protein